MVPGGLGELPPRSDPRAPQELRVHRDDDRAQRHQDRADCGRKQDTLPRQHASGERDGHHVVARRPPRGSGPSCGSCARLSRTIRGTSRGSLRTSTMSPASTATSVPAPIAMPDVGRDQRRSVVHAVAHHTHPLSCPLQLLDLRRPSRRAGPRRRRCRCPARQPQLRRRACASPVSMATSMPWLMQPPHGVPAIRVGSRRPRRTRPTPGLRGPADSSTRKMAACPRWAASSATARNSSGTATDCARMQRRPTHEQGSALDPCTHPDARDSLEPVGRGRHDAALPRGPDDAPGDGVLRVPLDRRRKPQRLLLVELAGRSDAAPPRTRRGSGCRSCRRRSAVRFRASSSPRRSRTRSPLLAPSVVEMAITSGTARPRAWGHEITSTVTSRSTAKAGSPRAASQATNVPRPRRGPRW